MDTPSDEKPSQGTPLGQPVIDYFCGMSKQIDDEKNTYFTNISNHVDSDHPLRLAHYNRGGGLRDYRRAHHPFILHKHA